MDGNLAGFVDRALMYNHLYIAHRFDPEGVLSTLPSIATCLLGVFTGEWIRGKHPQQLLRGLLIGAAVGIGAGKLWGIWFPINKNLWTSSFVLFTAGCALAVFAACYWLVDVRGWKRWAQPFVWFGVNPLAIYFAASWVGRAYTTHSIHGVLVKTIIWDAGFEHLSRNAYLNSVIFAACFTLLFWILAWALYRKKIFIRV
jgi:predicted acyltransferase